MEQHQPAWRILFRQALDPESAEVLDRIIAQVTGVVAALIAEDPGAFAPDETPAERERRITLLAQLLVGAAQSLANWWADNHDVPRAHDPPERDGLHLAGTAADERGRALAAGMSAGAAPS